MSDASRIKRVHKHVIALADFTGGRCIDADRRHALITETCLIGRPVVSSRIPTIELWSVINNAVIRCQTGQFGLLAPEPVDSITDHQDLTSYILLRPAFHQADQ